MPLYNRKPFRWMQRFMIMLIVAWIPVTNAEPEVQRLYSAIPHSGCAVVAVVDHERTLEELSRAYQWNALLDIRVAALNHDYLSPEQVLTKVDNWAQLIGCVAREFDIPPALLAGIMATELDLDYHVTDATVDSLVGSPFSDVFGDIEIGAAFGGIHFKHLEPALRSIGGDYSTSEFYQRYYHLTSQRSIRELTILATNHRLIDLANAAVMARYYALLRMGNRSLNDMTLTDMAFTWSAYRGGVSGTAADMLDSHRWSLPYLQKTDNPNVFGDTLIAMPYFSYFGEVYGVVRDNQSRL
jgi:hypothetical protein